MKTGIVGGGGLRRVGSGRIVTAASMRAPEWGDAAMGDDGEWWSTGRPPPRVIVPPRF